MLTIQSWLLVIWGCQFHIQQMKPSWVRHLSLSVALLSQAMPQIVAFGAETNSKAWFSPRLLWCIRPSWAAMTPGIMHLYPTRQCPLVAFNSFFLGRGILPLTLTLTKCHISPGPIPSHHQRKETNLRSITLGFWISNWFKLWTLVCVYLWGGAGELFGYCLILSLAITSTKLLWS